MRTLSLLLLAALAYALLIFGGAMHTASADVAPAVTTYKTAETTETTSTLERYTARMQAEADAREDARLAEGRDWSVPEGSSSGAGCGGDAACAAEHGLPEGSPITSSSTSSCEEDQPCWDARSDGNGQAGVGSTYGPRGTSCPSGGTYLVNEYGKRVCQY